MRKIDWRLLAFVSFGLVGQIPVVPPTVDEARIFKIFTTQVQQYVKLRKELEASLPAMKQTTQIAKITENQQIGRAHV